MRTRYGDTQSTISHETAHSVGRLLFGAVAAVFVLWLLTLLPGIDRLLPGTAITIDVLVRAVAAIAVAGVLAYTASELATLAGTSLRKSREVVRQVASIVYWLVVLAAILVLHWGLSPLATATLDEFGWVYDPLFLLVALGPLIVVAVRLYIVVDPAAEAFANRLTSGEEY